MANGSLERAMKQLRDLRKTMEQIYQEREGGVDLPAGQLKQLERGIEDIATHPALATNL